MELAVIASNLRQKFQKKKEFKNFCILKFDLGLRLSQNSLHFSLLRTQKPISYILKFILGEHNNYFLYVKIHLNFALETLKIIYYIF